MTTRRVAVLAVILATLSPVVAPSTWAQAEPAAAPAGPVLDAGATRTVDLPFRAFAAAIDPASGKVALLDARSDLVTILPKLAAEGLTDKTELKVGAQAVGVAYKQCGREAWFVVLCAGDKTLYLIDPVKLEVAAKIPLKGGTPSLLMPVASPSSPYVYVFGEPEAGTMNNEAVIHRVNLQTRAEEGVFQQYMEDLAEFAVSGDGLWLYGRHLNSSPAGLRAFKIDRTAKAPAFTAVANRHEDTSHYEVDPLGRYVLSGTRIFNADMSEPRELIALPQGTGWDVRQAMAQKMSACFLGDKPAFFVLHGGQVHAFSYNSLTPLGRVAIADWNEVRPRPVRPGPGVRTPEENKALSVGRFNRPYYAALLAAPKQQALVAIVGNKAAILPLAIFKLPDEPFLSVDVQGPVASSIDTPATFKLTKKDARAVISLADAPATARLVGDTLTWTPGAGDVGTRTMLLKVASADGKFERKQPIELAVRRPSLQLNFVPDVVVLAADGKSLLLVDTPKPGNDPHGRPMAATAGARLVILDVDKREITADRTLAVGARAFAIDATQVYAALDGSDAFYVLSRKDLTDVKRVFTKTHVQAMQAVGKRLFVQLQGENGMGALPSTYQLPETTPLETPDPAVYFQDPFGRAVGMPTPLAGGWYHRGLLYDAAMEKVRMVVEPAAFWALPGPPANFRDGSGREALLPVANWGVQIQYQTLRRSTGQNLGSLTGGTPMRPDGSGTLRTEGLILPDAPLAVALDASKPQNRNDGSVASTKIQLQVFDLVTAQKVDSITLADEPLHFKPGAGYPYENGGHYHVFAQGGLVLATVEDRIFFLDSKTFNAQKAPMPLHFPLVQGVFAVDLKKPATFDLKALGGKGPLEYAVTPESPAVSVDKATGKVTLDAAQIVDKLTDLAFQNIAQARDFYRPGTPPTSEKARLAAALDKYRTDAGKRYKEITGQNPTGVPMYLPLKFIAKDAEQLTAEIQMGFLIDVPSDAIDARIKKAEDELARQREAQIKAQRDYEARVAAGADQGGPKGDLQARIAELEKRNAQLEAQVQLLKELLAKSAPAASQPAHP